MGFFNVRATLEPDNRTRKFFLTDLPKDADLAAENGKSPKTWSRSETSLLGRLWLELDINPVTEHASERTAVLVSLLAPPGDVSV